jgi:hypothetical protein
VKYLCLYWGYQRVDSIFIAEQFCVNSVFMINPGKTARPRCRETSVETVSAPCEIYFLGKLPGRPLDDLTFVDGTPINTLETAAASVERWENTPSHHCDTIEDIAAMIWRFWKKILERDPTTQWNSLRIWKLDLNGAYTLLCFSPEQVGLFAMLLTNDLVYLQITGIFGWAGTLAAYSHHARHQVGIASLPTCDHVC